MSFLIKIENYELVEDHIEYEIEVYDTSSKNC